MNIMHRWIDFLTAKGEPRAFCAYRIIAFAVYCTSLTLAALWAFNSRGLLDAIAITVAAALSLVVIIGFTLLLAELGYEERHGIGGAVLVIDDDEGF